MGYQLQSNQLFYTTDDGHTRLLYITENSGKVVSRTKKDALTNDVPHPGIVIGEYPIGRPYIMHLHINNTVPVIDSIDDYANGQEVRFDDRDVRYGQMQVVYRAMDEWQKRPVYVGIFRNCQQFVSRIVGSEIKSETIEKWSNRVTGVGAILTFAGIFMKDKGVAKLGGTLMGVGITGKFLNRF